WVRSVRISTRCSNSSRPSSRHRPAAKLNTDALAPFRCGRSLLRDRSRFTVMPRLVFAAIRDESGATAIEYGLIAGCIALVVIGSATMVGGNLADWFQRVADAL